MSEKKARTLTAEWVRRRFLNHFYAALIEELEGDNDEAEFETINSRVALPIVSCINEAFPRWARIANNSQRQTQLEWLDYIYISIKFHVQFNETQLNAWSSEARQFIANNFDHGSFAIIFADQLHYALSLENFISIKGSTHKLKGFVHDNIRFFVAHQRTRLIAARDALEGIAAARRLNVKGGFDENYRIDPEYENRLKSSILIYEDRVGDVARFRSDLIGSIRNEFDSNFETLLRDSSRASIQTALRRLALDASQSRWYRARRNNRVELAEDMASDPSLRNNVGRIPFSYQDNRIGISSESKKKKNRQSLTPQLVRKQVDKSIEKLTRSATLSRIDNSDRFLREELEDYNTIFSDERHDENTVLSLFVSGQSIAKRLEINTAKDSDEQIDRDIVFLIQTLLSSHNLYIQCFPIYNEIVSGSERSAEMYRRIQDSAQNTPWSVLAELSRESDILEDRSRSVITKAQEALTSAQGSETKGLISIGMGLMKGALQSFTYLVINQILEAFEEEIRDKIKETARDFIQRTEITRKIGEFVVRCADQLLILATNSPSWFGWLNQLVSLVGK